MNINDKVVKTLEDTKDAINEKRHEAVAEAERAKRELAGSELSPSQKAESALNEAKNRAQAEISHAKREVRNEG